LGDFSRLKGGCSQDWLTHNAASRKPSACGRGTGWSRYPPNTSSRRAAKTIGC